MKSKEEIDAMLNRFYQNLDEVSEDETLEAIIDSLKWVLEYSDEIEIHLGI